MKLITGMHRSGTSLVANLLLQSGADLGNPKTFYPADKWNPQGYFEQQEIHDINMPLIRGPWGKLAYLRLPKPETIVRRADDLRDKIKKADNKYRHRVVKENRFCLTLAGWLEHGACIEKLVVVLRHPTEVALSLKKRNYLPLYFGYKLWYIHLNRLMDISRAIPIWYVSYQKLTDPNKGLGELKAVQEFLELDQHDNLEEIVKGTVMFRTSQVSHPNLTGDLGELWKKLVNRHKFQFLER